MTGSTARSYIVRLAVVSSVACAAWYFVVRPMRDRLAQQRVLLSSTEAEIESGLGQIAASTREPAEVIGTLRERADTLSQLWGVSADASVLYEEIDAIAHRYGVVVERMEPSRGGARAQTSGDDDTPAFNEIGYSIELVGAYEGVARFVRGIQNELGMARIESLRVTPMHSGDNRVRASVKTSHFQATGGLTAFETTQEVSP